MAAGDRAVVEVIIRARDEASATVATTLQKITTEAKSAETAITKLGRGGQAVDAVTDLVKGFEQGSDSAGAMVGSLGSMAAMFGGPWGIAIAGASQLVAGYISHLEAARKEQAALAAEVEKFAGRANRAQGQLEGLSAQDAEARARSLYGEGNRQEAAKAAQEADAALQRRLVLQQKEIDLQERREIAAFQKRHPGAKPPEELAAAFAKEREVLEARFALDQDQRMTARANALKRFDDEQIQRLNREAQERTKLEEKTAQQAIAAQTRAAQEATKAWEASVAERARMERQLQADLAGLFGQAQEARRRQGETMDERQRRLENEGPRISAYDLAQTAQDNLRRAQQAQADFRAGASVSREEFGLMQRLPELERIAGRPMEEFFGETSKVSTDLDKAAESAAKVTEKIKELATTLKTLETQPGFVQRLSQELADTLVFMGQRQP